jgi:hypothetical protein
MHIHMYYMHVYQKRQFSITRYIHVQNIYLHVHEITEPNNGAYYGHNTQLLYRK